MKTRSHSQPFLLLLLLVAVALLAVLAGRSFFSERVAAERAARDALVVQAGEGVRMITQASMDAIRLARDGGDGIPRVANGVFVSPRESVPVMPLSLPAGRDSEGSWLLTQGALAEQKDRFRAMEIYRAASVGGRDMTVRREALFRLIGLLRREGEAEELAKKTELFLSLLTPEQWSQTKQALLLRSLNPEEDPSLAEDLLLLIGGPDTFLAEGLLAKAGLTEPDLLDSRWQEVAIIKRLRPLLEKDPEKREVMTLLGEVLVARISDDRGAVSFGEVPMPEFPEEMQVRSEGGESGVLQGMLEEAVQVGDLLPGVLVIASTSLDGVRRGADRRSLLLICGIAVLLLAALVAVRQTLVASRRESEAATDRSRFLARVGHDLRTPLSIIRMYSETLADGKVQDEAKAREFASIAAREAERLSSQVDTVLDLTRIQDPSRENAYRRVDLSRIAQEVVTSQRPLLDAASMVVTVDVPADEVWIRVDSDALRGALANLVENALRHAADGGDLWLRVEADEKRARLEVGDRGRGVPDGEKDLIFERFSRGAGEKPRGSGLGLALVREVAEHAGGAVHVMDRDGGGALFVLEFPLDRKQSAETERIS